MKKYVLLSLLAFNTAFPLSLLNGIRTSYNSYPARFKRDFANPSKAVMLVGFGLAYWKAPFIVDRCFGLHRVHTLTPQQESAIRSVLAKLGYTKNIRIRGVHYLGNACVTPAGMYVDPYLIFDPKNFNQLSFEGEGIIGHEGIHARDNHILKSVLGIWSLQLGAHALLHPLYDYLEPKNSYYKHLAFDRVYNAATLLPAALLGIQTFCKHSEKMADIRSAEILGADPLISFFRKIKSSTCERLLLLLNPKNMPWPQRYIHTIMGYTDPHPSLGDRIDYLMELKIKQNLDNLTPAA